ncbi:hypothetical protein KKE03_01815 [Patescibacteria group bacterium]|nr:hypothetical protein [Patescibacteria group bacterium]
MKEIISYLKKEWRLLLIFILLISFSQAFILKPHLEFGFTPDDVRLISDYIALGPNPLSQFGKVWQDLGGPHMVNPLYYNGILYGILGFDYQAYQIAGLIFKIFSVISFYLLVRVISKNRLLSFISGIIFSFHYGSVGSMEMVARTQDYLVITGLNIFLLLFYLINAGRLKNIFWLILSSLILFSAFFINPIRAYPILPFICFLAIFIFFNKISLSNFYKIAKNLTIIFLPFMLFFGLQGTGGVFYGNTLVIIQKVSLGNFQMLLSPFSSFGSIFLTGDILRSLGSPTWTLNNFLGYFLGGPLIIFGGTTIILSKILSQKPLKFFLGVFVTNFFLELLFFFAIDHGMNLPTSFKMSYDPYTFATPAILGGYILVITLFIFLEWFRNRQNIYLSLYLLGISLAVTFVWFTWILYDFVSIPMGVYGYSTIPSMGISAAIASTLVLAYTKISKRKGLLKSFAPSVFLLLILYFFFSNDQIQKYLQYNIAYGNDVSGQIYLKNKFWQFLKDDSNPCNNFFFLDTRFDFPNGYNYSFIMIDRFDRWYSLYSPYGSKKPCPVALLVSDEEKLLSSYTKLEGKEGFLYKYFNGGGNNFFSLDNFYAFKLQNRDIIDIKPEILKKLRLSPL